MIKRLSEEEIITALREKGLKATSQRIAICRIVLSSREHPTAQIIYDNVKKIHPTVSLATVYKTLGVLTDLNLIQELPLKQGDTRYDAQIEPHFNLICERCRTVKDIHDEELARIILRIAKKTKFILKNQRIDLYGICQDCVRGTR